MANKNIFKIHISKPCCVLEIVHVMGSCATLKIRRSKVHFAIDILTLKQVLESPGISSPCQLPLCCPPRGDGSAFESKVLTILSTSSRCSINAC